MKTNWLIIMLLAGVTANAQVYIGSNPNGRPSPGVALEVESNNMGIQFPVIHLAEGETLEQKYTSTNSSFNSLPEGSMVYVTLAANYQTSNAIVNTSKYKTNGNGFYVKSSIENNSESARGEAVQSPNLSWEFSGVVEERFINNQVVNEFLGYGIYPYEDLLNVPNHVVKLTETSNGYDFKFCKTNSDTNHTYCVFKDNGLVSNNKDWESAYKLAKAKGGYLFTITNQKEYDFVLNNVLNYNGVDFNSNTINLKEEVFNTWMGFTNYVMKEFNPYSNKTDINSNGEFYIGNIKYLWITGEEFLMDWENSTLKGALVETSKYYKESDFANNNISQYKSAYLSHTRNQTTSLENTISARLNSTQDSSFKYVIVEYTN